MSREVPAPLGTVAHYTLLERLEPAGPGELYRARDTHRGRTVTVRLLPRGFAPDPAAFEAGARGLIALSHPNVIALFDVGDHDGRLFLVFEYLKGQSLRAEMAGRMLNVRRAVDLAVQMTDAVADAHAAGFLHSGLSPDSIAVTAKGHAKIPALELAAHGGLEETTGGVRLRDYESPEEARGERPDERADVFSLGAILYEMLTTRRPNHRGAAAPSAANPHVPKELDEVVLRAVAPNRDNRYQTAAVLAAELRRVAASVDSRGGAGDEEEVQVEAAASTSRVLVIAIAILAAVALIAWWFMRS
jgi:serine/threonine protein kinase